jgi:hypothetical protein
LRARDVAFLQPIAIHNVLESIDGLLFTQDSGNQRPFTVTSIPAAP